ncbi:hypothetical protein ACFFQW_41180 [Umezawaea endophytica]|uniref:Secreted protein n=1 Tax=Umezawaea endophytica TaxID=1654476 RepID=A0A9X2VFQ0_9PSEU|nr:hypothetical protein [Umezawaea endophytica]MCS7475736.1 hypothetical protein [Umezawaea endophytica]
MVATKRLAAATFMALATGLGMVATASPAVAQTNTEVYSDDDNPGGMAWFVAEGEHFGVCDRQNDSLGVRGKLTWTDSGGSHERKLWHHNGHWPDRPDLSCSEYTKDFNIPEGTTVYLQVCLQKEKGATLKFCDTDTGVA